MASKETYVSDKELTELYGSLEKDSLVKMLIEKYRITEQEQVNVTLGSVSKEELEEQKKIAYDAGWLDAAEQIM